MRSYPLILTITGLLLKVSLTLASPQPVVDDRLIRAVNANHQEQLLTLYRQHELLQAQLQTQLYLRELNDNDHLFLHKQDWDELNQLSIKANFLMEHHIGTFDEYESLLNYLSARINNSAWEKCLESLNCDFAKVKLGLQSKELKALKTSSLEVKEARQQLKELQEYLVKVGAESQSSQGYAELLDALLKVSQISAQSLNLLSKQLNTLLTLKINDLSAQRVEKQTEQAIEERFVKIGQPAGSVTHFDLKVSPYVK